MRWGFLSDFGGAQRFALFFVFALFFSAAYLVFALPSVSFVPPTLNDSATTGFTWVFVNVASSEPLNQSLLEWGNSSGYFNFTMLNSSQTNWFLNVSNLTDGYYNYTVWAQNTTGNWNRTGRRFVAVDTITPIIAAWSTNGTNASNSQDTMFLVSAGESVLFNVSATGANLSYQWLVNKADQNRNAGNFTFNVPNLKNIWEIHLKINGSSGNEAHKEWVISSYNLSEAPIAFDSFSDGRFNGTRDTDPWGRTLPQWFRRQDIAYNYPLNISAGNLSLDMLAADYTGGFAELNNSVAYGTWVVDVKAIRNQSDYFVAPYGRDTDAKGGVVWVRQLRSPQEGDQHTFFDMQDIDYSDIYEDEEIVKMGDSDAAMTIGSIPMYTNNWYSVRIVRYPNGEFKIWQSKNGGEEILPTWARVTVNNSINYAPSFFLNIDSKEYLFDNIRIFNYSIEPPVSTSYNATSNTIEVTGNATLSGISFAINNASLFSYNSTTRTAWSNASIHVMPGYDLTLNNETLLMNPQSDGGISIYLHNDRVDPGYSGDANLFIYRSNITSASSYRYDLNIYGNSKIAVWNSTITRVNTFYMWNAIRIFPANVLNSVLEASYHEWRDTYGEVDRYGRGLVFDNVTIIGNPTIRTGDDDPTFYQNWVGVGGNNTHQGITKAYNASYRDPAFKNVNFTYSSLGSGYDDYTSLMNTKTVAGVNLDRTDNGRFMVKYYLDVLASGIGSNPISNITVFVTNDVNQTDYYATNYDGDRVVSTLTGQDGHTPLPLSDKSNTVIVTDFWWKNATVSQNMTYTILAYDTSNIWTNVTHTIYPNGTIQQLQPLANVSGINPSSSWYRSNPNSYQNTTVLQINYTRTNITVNAGLNATNITVKKWNTSLPQGQILVNFTAESVNGNNVNFTVCSLTASTNYVVKNDGSAFATKTSDSSGCVWFNNSVWTSHVFTLEEQSQGPSGCSAINAATYNATVNKIYLRNQTSTLCTIYYDINNQSLISYNISANTYTLYVGINNYSTDAKNNGGGGQADLIVNDATLSINSTNGTPIYITATGRLTIRNATIRSVDAAYYWGIYGYVNQYETSKYDITRSTFYDGFLMFGRSITHTGEGEWVNDSAFIHGYAPALYAHAVLKAGNLKNITVVNSTSFGSYSGIVSGYIVDGLRVYDSRHFDDLASYGGLYLSSGGNSANLYFWNTTNNGTASPIVLGSKEGFCDQTITNLTVAGNSGQVFIYHSQGYGWCRNRMNDANISSSFSPAINWNANSWADLDVYTAYFNNVDTAIRPKTKSLVRAINLGFVNVTTHYYTSDTSEVLEFSLADVAVADVNTNSLGGTRVYFSANDGESFTTNDNITFGNVINANFYQLNYSETKSDGHLPLPLDNASATVALLRYRQNTSAGITKYYSYNISAYDPSSIWTNITHTIYPDGIIQQLEPLAQATNITPYESWYRPNPNSYQNTTVLQINYTRTNITVKAGLNATNITVKKWNTSLPQGQILVNFTAESVNGNNVNFTVCSLTASTNYVVKKDGSAFATKTSDSSGCVRFNNSAWTSHTFTMAEQSQGPSGCSAINAAFYNTSSNTIVLNNQISTLCTIYYDVNNVSVLSYNATPNEYTLNSNVTIGSAASDLPGLRVANAALKFNYNSGDNMMGIRSYGNLNISNATLSALNISSRPFIIVDGKSGTESPYPTKAPYVDIQSSSFNHIYIVNLQNTYWTALGREIKNSNFNGSNTAFRGFKNIINTTVTNWDGNTYGISGGNLNNVTVHDSASWNYILYYSKNVTNSLFYNLNTSSIRTVITPYEADVSMNIENNIVHDFGAGYAIDVETSYAYTSPDPVMVRGNYIYNATSAKGIEAGGGSYVHVINNTVNNVNVGLKLDRTKNNITSKNNNLAGNSVGLDYELFSDTFPNVTLLSINDDFSNSTTYDIFFKDWGAPSSASKPKFINAKYNLSKVYFGEGGSVLYDYKYLDVKVVDAAGTPISNAVVNTINPNDTNYPPIDINGLSRTSFNTSSDGHTLLPDGNESNSIAVMAFWKNSTYQQNMTYAVSAYDPTSIWTNVTHAIYPNGTILQLQPLAQVSGVNPNESWYRPDPNVPTHTVNLTVNYARTNLAFVVADVVNVSVFEYSPSLVNFSAVGGLKMNVSVSNGTFPVFTGYPYALRRDGVLESTKIASAGGVSFMDVDVGGAYLVELYANLSVSLDFPQDNWLTNSPLVVFNCSAFSNNSLRNVSLYGNFSGVFVWNGSVNVSGSVNETTFTRTLPDGSYGWNCLASDNTGRAFAAKNYSLRIDTVPPSSIVNLANQSQSTDWIFWNWTNPVSDFDHVEVFLNGSWRANTSNNFYNATGLSPNSWHALSVRAVDAAGNVNFTWVNSTARTLADTAPPTIVIILPGNTTYNYNQSLPLNFSVSEPVSWCSYSLDGAQNVTVPGCLNTTFNVSGNGGHSLRLYANDSFGNLNSTVVYFSVDVGVPVLSNVSSSVDVDSAVVSWDSDELANSTVFYWIGSNPVSSVGNGSFVLHHYFSLGGLSSSTLYYYNISACDVVGNCNVSAGYSFTTSSGGSGGPSGSYSPSGGAPVLESGVGAKSVLWDRWGLRVVVSLKSELSSPALAVGVPVFVPVPAPGGLVYQYLNISRVNFNNSDILNATIEFRVNKSWIARENVAQVYLARYAGGWIKLKTELVNSTSTQNTYRAVVSGFSYFVVVGVPAVGLSPDVRLPLVDNGPVPAVSNQSAVILTQGDIDAAMGFVDSVLPETRKARELLEGARLKVGEAQRAFDGGELERARILLGEARGLAENAVELKAVSVAGEKSVILAILFALLAIMLWAAVNTPRVQQK